MATLHVFHDSKYVCVNGQPAGTNDNTIVALVTYLGAWLQVI